MARHDDKSLGAGAAQVQYKKRTTFQADDEECESHGRRGKKITNEERGKYEPIGCDHWRSLHHHTTYSHLDGYRRPDIHVRRAAELGMDRLAVTEHGNISSHAPLQKACEDLGVTPVFGVELYCNQKEPKQRKNHLTALAIDVEGYRNMLRLVTESWENFHYEPTSTFPMLQQFGDGIIFLSGCTGSELATSLVGGKNVAPEDASYGRARKVARRFKREFDDRYYLEVQAFPELEVTCQINQAYERMSRELGIPLVATADVHYTRPNESEMQQILHNVRGGNKKTLEQAAQEWGYNVPLSPPTSDRYIYRRLRATGLSKRAAWEAIYNSEIIANRCNVVLPKMPMLRYPLPPGYKNSEQLFRDWLLDGWAYRGIADAHDIERYREQLAIEMRVIRDKDYIDYFLIVSDLVRYAKDRGYPVGPARGSAAASLVSYLLRITEVDPMRFPNLLFERFIDPTRKDLPDIDLDFSSEAREPLRQYLIGKYGEKSVGNVGTFTVYKAKLSLDDTARAHRIPQDAVETVKSLLVERSSGDLRGSTTIRDTAEMFDAAAQVFENFPNLADAMKLEGEVKAFGIHAAGIVVANGDLSSTCATYTRVTKGVTRRVLSVDKHDAEYLNLLKIDALSLVTMDMIAECLRMIGRPLEWLYEIPLDDEKTIEGFRRNQSVGIFQFDGRAMRGVTEELAPDNFLEVADITALARPGPLHNGAAAEYIDVKQGAKEPRRYHPLVDAITGYTHGQIVYQEQILRICGEIGQFDYHHRSTIRKIISKKLGEQEFNRWRNQFVEGAATVGVKEADADAIWKACITAGAYAFNVAHAISYGMLAWWTMYLKQHHPAEFYCSCLMWYDEKKTLELLKDARKQGFHVRPPHPKRSNASWEIRKGRIYAGFTQIPGIGEKTAEAIMRYRDEHGLDRWEQLINVKGIGDKTIEKILAFVTDDDPFGILRLERKVQEVREAARGPLLGKIPLPTHTSEQIPYARDGRDLLVVWCGVITTRNLKELFEVHFSRTGEELDRATVEEPDKSEWVNMWGDDGTDIVTITVDRFRYDRFRKRIWGLKLDEDMVVIRGVKKGYQSRRAIKVLDMWVLA